MALKTDYKDYQFQEGETYRKYRQIFNDDGTVSFEDVTNYQQVGNRFSASDINATNGKVNELQETVSQSSVFFGDGEDTPMAPMNADLLGGHPASYFATSEELDTAIANSGLKMDLLWTNASPTSGFNSQTISLDLSQYKLVLIEIILAVGSWSVAINKRQTICLAKGFEGYTAYGLYNDYFVYRDIKVNPDSIEMKQAYFATSAGYTGSTEIVIPFKIYGIK